VSEAVASDPKGSVDRALDVLVPRVHVNPKEKVGQMNNCERKVSDVIVGLHARLTLFDLYDTHQSRRQRATCWYNSAGATWSADYTSYTLSVYTNSILCIPQIGRSTIDGRGSPLR